MMLTQMPKVGDKVRFISDDYRSFMTEGKVYEVTENHDSEFVIKDDDGDNIFWRGIEFYKFEIVAEPSEEIPVEASPTVIELLANISRRLYEAEQTIKPSEPSKVDAQDETVDNVNSPQHYRHGRFETIELIEDITKKYDDGFVAYCVGNAVKYVDRAPFKHGSPSEDLRKAAWYLTRAAEHMDEKGAV